MQEWQIWYLLIVNLQPLPLLILSSVFMHEEFFQLSYIRQSMWISLMNPILISNGHISIPLCVFPHFSFLEDYCIMLLVMYSLFVTVWSLNSYYFLWCRLNFLSINRFERKKNIDLALSAFVTLQMHEGDHNISDVNLTIAGKSLTISGLANVLYYWLLSMSVHWDLSHGKCMPM